MAAHNFSPHPATVDVTVPDGDGGSWQLEDVHSGLCLDLDRRGTARVDLEAYGHQWWRLRDGA